MTALLAPALLLLAALPQSAASDDDRLPPERMEQLVGREIDAIATGEVERVFAKFDQRLAQTQDVLKRADLLESFGVQLYIEITSGYQELPDQALLKKRCLEALAAAIPLYRQALGSDHREVAMAIVTYADVLFMFNESQPSADTDDLYREAHRIRVATLGRGDPVTVATLVSLARTSGALARTGGDQKQLDRALTLLNEALADLGEGVGDRAVEVRGRIYQQRAWLNASYGKITEALAIYDLAVADTKVDCATPARVTGKIIEGLELGGYSVDENLFENRTPVNWSACLKIG